MRLDPFNSFPVAVKMNPSLLDRILEMVKLEYKKVSDAFEKLKQSVAVVELALK
ncbi:MAG: hypothetical protein RMI04_09205 [Thermofilaceae archaeon]|nr:hypothetical protein [Thermofilaceae archaeon]